jgi:5-methylcytosine-specific restriction endonuclease McrA
MRSEAAKRATKKRAERIKIARSRGTHTREQWLALLSFCGTVCLKCGFKNPTYIQKDHIIPVFCVEECTDSIENLQPLCYSCNYGRRTTIGDLRPAGWREHLTSLGLM